MSRNLLCGVILAGVLIAGEASPQDPIPSPKQTDRTAELEKQVATLQRQIEGLAAAVRILLQDTSADSKKKAEKVLVDTGAGAIPAPKPRKRSGSTPEEGQQAILVINRPCPDNQYLHDRADCPDLKTYLDSSHGWEKLSVTFSEGRWMDTKEFFYRPMGWCRRCHDSGEERK